MFKEIAKFITSSSLLLALDAPLIVLFGYLLYGTQINYAILVAASLAVFAIYNLNKATDKVEDAINRPEAASRSTKHYVTSAAVSLSASLAIGAFINPIAFAILIVPILVGLLYSIKIIPGVPRLKELTGAKSFVVAFSWSIYGTFLPVVLQAADPSKITLVFSYIFMQVLVNTILFDVLDTKGDAISGVKTIPLALGKAKTRFFLIISNSTLALWLAFCVIEGLFIQFVPALLFGIIYGYFIIWHFLKNPNQRLRAELLIDGQWIPIVALMKLFIR
ncbi:MAG: UbiA family prenyltransferase [Candidatus Bathyarchaeota archaeon]|nr:UbiA family prenyltransferase [Candidatus Bathyarchaeota archaeon]